MKVLELAADLGQLVAVQGNLTVLAAGIIHVQDPMGMAGAASAFGAALGVEGFAMKVQLSAQLCTIYMDDTSIGPISRHFCAKMFGNRYSLAAGGQTPHFCVRKGECGCRFTNLIVTGGLKSRP
jgi:hypothetical protein